MKLYRKEWKNWTTYQTHYGKWSRRIKIKEEEIPFHHNTIMIAHKEVTLLEWIKGKPNDNKRSSSESN